ncbi:RHS repeat-associated core domain-containing protein [Dactylosporangium sp. NPDC049742]|uniref:RHS repeat domain-containing protein n=1 Tax=Dactylosporangium sp. NPDC049742 TaxID=3154737 RepID=UPI003423C0D3
MQVLDRATAKTSGRSLVVRLTRSDASPGTATKIRAEIDYSRFRDAYGGDWASRLRLVSLPECALRTPQAPECQASDLPSMNDVARGTVTATVPLATAASGGNSAKSAASVPSGAMVALASSAQSSGGGGDYSAGPFSPTASWTAGGQSGDFSWSYPIRTPAALNGPSPSVGLSYSAQSLDGKTAASNNQPSWIGDGFDFSPGQVNRVYPACADDGKTGIGDLCWGTDNANLSLSGHSGELIQVSTSPDRWKLQDDDGTLVERLTGATNGARNGEYWKVTTADGWQYFFGLNRLPGWSSGKSVTQSVFTVPVFGNNSGEPCYNATFANASCDQAYAWNLDYVIDPHGNSMSLWYAQQLNHYARNVTPSTVSTYVRAGHIDHIDYGTRQDNGVDSIYSTDPAPARVAFGLADRCVTPGSGCVQTNPSNWPDVPWDQQCDSTTSCGGVFSPALFTQKRLSTITTQVRSGTGFRDVERWTLNHVFKDPGDGHAKTLWLNSIAHAGLNNMPAGTSTTMPDITFTGVQLSNRVDTSPTKNPIIRFRISSIVNESGAVTAVTYSQPECVVGSNMPASADNNTKRCFPVYWTPYGTATATFDWFHKYVVTGVTVSDPTGHAPAEETTYTYQGSPAWHYDNSELTPANHRSWGQWRGYERVRTLHGAASSAQEQSDSVYFRGMHGDKTSTGTRTVTIAADTTFGGLAINDEDWRNGTVRESIVYNGVGDSAPVLSKTVYEPWESSPTATRTRNGITITAYLTGLRSTTQKVALAAGGWLTMQSTNTFDTETGVTDPIGRVVKVADSNDTSKNDDDRCTTVTYATHPTGAIKSAIAQKRVVAASCAATPNLTTDLISEVRTRFDGAATFNGVITKGDATAAEHVKDVVAGSPVYTTHSTATYDAHGRTLTFASTGDDSTTTSYSPATGALPTTVTTTNAAGWLSTTTLDDGYGGSLSETDPNGRRTETTYDGLGRATAVWLPGRDKATQTASKKYTYVVGGSNTITSTATSVLTTDGTGYSTSYELYDALLRPRQVQSPAVGGGVVLVDNFYDSRGRTVQSNDAYFQSGVSWGTLFVPSSPTPSRNLITYDNAGRASAVKLQVNGVDKWQSSTTFGGDYSDQTVPVGGSASRTTRNVLGQVTEIRRYRGNTPTGAYDKTTYTFDKRGYPATIKDEAGSIWSFEYDVLGRNIKTIDPDRGTSTYTYNDAGRQLTVTDGSGVTLTNVYDATGRAIATYQGDQATGTKLTDTTYDTLAKGHVTSSTRYVNGNAYTSTITAYSSGYQPAGLTVTIPASEGAVAGSYSSSSTFNADGSLATTTLPAIGGGGAGSQPSETLTYGYNSAGLLKTLTGLQSYVADTTYDAFGRMTGTLFNDGGAKNLAQLWSYEPGTGRLLEHGIYDNDTGDVFQDAYYDYDNAGNVTSIKDLTAQYGAGPDDNQCFKYDYAQRLTNAWTPASGTCAADPTTVTAAQLGGPSPYWQAWTYDSSGNRLTQKVRTAAGDTTSTYAYPVATAARPHAVTGVTVTGAAGNSTSSYAYDVAGNMRTRAPAGKPEQTLSWDAEGHLAGVTDTNNVAASYIYGTDGGRLITHDSTGTTLYLGPQEIHVSNSNVVSTTRQYSGNAVRTSAAGLCWVTSDAHGTGNLTFVAATLSKTQRRTTPFGAVRGADPSWPTTRGFVGGVNETTGLVQVGARPYDPGLGRFVTVDPQFNSADAQTFNGYAYANNNPTTMSDPSGLSHDNGGSGGITYSYRKVGHWSTNWTRNGFRIHDEYDTYILCSSDGRCQAPGGWISMGIGNPLLFYFLVLRTIVPMGPKPSLIKAVWVDPKLGPSTLFGHGTQDQCITDFVEPEPPKCGFFGEDCHSVGQWWHDNKGIVIAGLAVASVVACVTGVGCLATGAFTATVAVSDRAYTFVHNEEYNAGWAAWSFFIVGIGADVLGAIPGVGAEKAAAQAARAAWAQTASKEALVAKAASMGRDKPNRAAGIFLADGHYGELMSGHPNRLIPELDKVPGMASGFDHHPEMQVVRWFHANPDVMRGKLYMDKLVGKGPCDYCGPNLNELLPTNVELLVFFPLADGSVGWRYFKGL